MSSETAYTAVQMGSEEPLLEEKASSAKALLENFSKFKTSSLCIGLLVGCFIQASTLGANYLLVSIWGEQDVLSSEKDVVFFSLFWSLFTSTLAIIILSVLRNLVQATYMTDDEEENDRVDDMLLHMECRFVVGALIGVCGAWAATDALMGLTVQIAYSVVTLIAALAWCQVMMWFFAAPARRTIETPDVLMIA